MNAFDRLLRLSLCAGLIALGDACTRNREQLPSGTGARWDSTELEFAGCAVLRSGGRCTLAADRGLRVWLPDPQRLTAHVDGARHALAAPSRPIAGGHLYSLTLPRAAKRLILRDERADWAFTLALGEPEVVPALEQAAQLRARGEFTQARELLEAALPSLSGASNDRAKALLARLALSAGDHAAAVQGLRASLESAYTAQRVSDVVQDASALSFVLCSNLRRYGEARDVLERAARFAAQDPSSRALLPHYQGVLALETGDLRSALELFRTAVARTERLGLREHELLAREQSASVLAILGRHAEAVQAQEQVVAAFGSDDACKRSDRQETVTWFALLAEPPPDSPLARTALRFSELAEESLAQCPSPWRRRNHRINAALLALSQGEVDRARQLLADLPALEGEDSLLEAWEHEARGRSYLASGQLPSALASFERALTVAIRTGLWENQHLAWLGSARALSRLGRTDQALQSYQRAEALLDDALGFVPLSEGQAGFQHAREAGTAELVDLLAGLNRVDDAFDVARRARARVIAALSRDARLTRLDSAQRAHWETAVANYRSERERLEQAEAQAWRVPSDALAAHAAELDGMRQAARSALDAAHAVVQRGLRAEAAPPLHLVPGELVLAYFPAARGLRAFLAADSGTRTVALPDFQPGARASAAELGAALLGPFRDALRGAKRLRVMSHAALFALDVHAFELEGAVLSERVPISYALDLAAAVRGEASGSREALVVANPTGDLAASELEAKAVLVRLDARHSRLLQRQDASRAHVLAGLLDADSFHFAGHARYAGLEGIDSNLLLADGELTLGDILNLPRVPARVVLSACESARSQGPGFSSGLGLAQAFLAAGADSVLAATRPVNDGLARQFFVEFYAELAADGGSDVARTLQVATRRLRTTQPADDWAAFRLLTR